MGAVIKCEMTDATELHCFKLTLQNVQGQRVEILLHATSLLELIGACSRAFLEWGRVNSERMICMITRLTPEQARARGLLAPKPAQPPPPPPEADTETECEP